MEFTGEEINDCPKDAAVLHNACPMPWSWWYALSCSCFTILLALFLSQALPYKVYIHWSPLVDSCVLRQNPSMLILLEQMWHVNTTFSRLPCAAPFNSCTTTCNTTDVLSYTSNGIMVLNDNTHCSYCPAVFLRNHPQNSVVQRCTTIKIRHKLLLSTVLQVWLQFGILICKTITASPFLVTSSCRSC